MLYNFKHYPVNKTLRVGFAVILSLLLAIASVSYVAIDQLIESKNWVAHTHEVIAMAEAVRSDIQQMESGERGYFILGTDSAITQYQSGFQQYYPDLRRLKQLTFDNHIQQNRIAELIDKCEEKVAICEQIIQAHRLGQDENAIKIKMSGRSNASMNEIRTLIGEIIGEEYRLLRERTSQAAKQTGRAKIMIPSLCLLSFIIMVASYTYIIYKVESTKHNCDGDSQS